MGYFGDLVNLLYPRCCAGCGMALSRSEESICTMCQIDLPRAHLHDFPDNQIERIFWMRADVKAATAFLRMPPQGMVHQLMHELKYHNNPGVGRRLGQLFASELIQSDRMGSFDTIVPVPLHPRRLRERGYNQCQHVAEGMNDVLRREVILDNLIRARSNETQTRRGGRWSRWENVSGIFAVSDPSALEGKRVMLIDDVITTGATIEACAAPLNAIRGLELLVGALAYPVR